jgi:hypothetical protein
VGDFDEAAFFDCITVDKLELAKFLGQQRINALCKRAKPSPASALSPTPRQLHSDFQLPYFLDVTVDQLGELLGPALKQIKKGQVK